MLWLCEKCYRTRHLDRWLLAAFFVLLLLLVPLVVARAHEVKALTIPFARSGKWILVQVAVNGKPGTFVLDTGAQDTLVSEDLAKDITDRSPAKMAGWDAMRKVEKVSVSLDLGGDIWVGNVLSTSLKNVTEKTQVDGVLGMSVLEHYSRIEIDFKAKTVTFHKDGSSVSPCAVGDD